MKRTKTKYKVVKLTEAEHSDLTTYLMTQFLNRELPHLEAATNKIIGNRKKMGKR